VLIAPIKQKEKLPAKFLFIFNFNQIKYKYIIVYSMLRRKRREMRRWADSNKNNKHALQKNTIFKIPFRHPINTVPNNNNCNQNTYTNKKLRTNIPPAKYHRKNIQQCESNSNDVQNRDKNLKTPVIGMPPLPFPIPLPQPPKLCKPLRPVILSQKQYIENKKKPQDCSSCNCVGDQLKQVSQVPRILNLKYKELLKSQNRRTAKGKANVANFTLPGSLYSSSKPTWKKFLNKKDYCNVDFDCPCDAMRTSYIDFLDYDLNIKAKNISIFDPNKRYVPPFNTPVEKISCIKIPLPYIINKIPDTEFNITPFNFPNLTTITVVNEDFLFQQFSSPEESPTNNVQQIYLSSNKNPSQTKIRSLRKSPTFNTEPIHPRNKNIHYKNILDYAYQFGEPLFLHQNNFSIPYVYSYIETEFKQPWNPNTITTKYISTNITDYIPKLDLFGKSFPIIFESKIPPNLYEEPLEFKINKSDSFPKTSFLAPSPGVNSPPPLPTNMIPLFDLSVNFTGPSTYVYQLGEPTYDLEKEQTNVINIVDTKIEILFDNFNTNIPPVINPPKITTYHDLDKNFKYVHNNTEHTVAIHQLNEPSIFKTLNYIKYNNVAEIFDIDILKPKITETISDVSNLFDLPDSNSRKITKDSFFKVKNTILPINFNYFDTKIYQLPDNYILKDNERTNLKQYSYSVNIMKKYQPYGGNFDLENHIPFDIPEFEKKNFYYDLEKEYTIFSGVIPCPIITALDPNINDELRGVVDFLFEVIDITLAPSVSKVINSSASITDNTSTSLTLPNDIVSLFDYSNNISNTRHITSVAEKLPFVKQIGAEFIKQREFIEVFKGDDFSFKCHEYPILITPDELVTSFREKKQFLNQIGVPPRLIARVNFDYQLYYYEKDIPPFDFEKVKNIGSTLIPDWSSMYQKLPNKQKFITYKRNSIFQIGEPIAYDNHGNALQIEKNIRCISTINNQFLFPYIPIMNIKKYDIDIDQEYTIIRNITPAPITNKFVVNINDLQNNNDFVFTYQNELPAFDFIKFKHKLINQFPSWNSIQTKSITTNTYNYFKTPNTQIGEPTAYIDENEFRLPYIKERLSFSTPVILTPHCKNVEYLIPRFNIANIVLDPNQEYFIMSITPGI